MHHIYHAGLCCLTNLAHLKTCLTFLDQLLVGLVSVTELHQNSGSFLAQHVAPKPHPLSHLFFHGHTLSKRSQKVSKTH